MTRVLIIFCSFSIISSFGQTNILKLKDQKYYTERNIILNDSVFTLSQNVCYDMPEVVDEEGCYWLKLTFLDTFYVRRKKIIDLSTCPLVKGEYGLDGQIILEPKSKVIGQIEILKWESESIRIKENIEAYDLIRGGKVTFIGTRTFLKIN